MNCPNCGRYLGEGMLPARCPACGANLANPTDSIRGSKASTSRRNVEGLTGIGKGNTSARRRHYVQVSIALLLALGGVALLLFAWRGFGTVGELTVPDVVGWRQDRAEEELVGLGYGVVVETVYDESQMEGIVLSQEPSAGVAAVAGSQVRITVATSRVMPEVVGLTREQAEAVLSDAGIPYTVREELSDETAARVIEASVGQGTALAEDEVVELVVAVPPTMPDVVGKTQAEATRLIEAQSLAVKVVLTVPEGSERASTEGGQAPTEGARATAESAQTTTEGAPAPTEDGQAPTEGAQATAEGSQAPVDGTVVAQDPAAGTTLPMNSEVEIQIATTREQQLKEAAATVLAAIYDTDPANDQVGQRLKPLLSEDSPYADQTPHDIWWNLVKRGGRYQEQPDELQSLRRSLTSSELTVDPERRTVTAKITVDWDWTGLPGAGASESQDTRTVTMRFDDEGKLVDFEDAQTDVPFFKVD